MRIQVLVIRLILGAGFGVVLSRFFYPDAPVTLAVGLGAGLVALAYLTEYLRNRSRARSGKKQNLP